MSVISPQKLYYPQSAVMFQRYATVVAGDVLLFSHDALQDFAHYIWQDNAANGDSFAHPFYLAQGTYTLNVLGRTANNTGRLDWYIDGLKVVSLQDWYSVGTVSNVVKTAVVAVAGHGQHVLKGVVNGQNVASSNYRIFLTAIALV